MGGGCDGEVMRDVVRPRGGWISVGESRDTFPPQNEPNTLPFVPGAQGHVHSRRPLARH